ncbi:hypothetical protein NP493_662g00015 [Ridgeia piscesae]|uniref:Pex N-terminal domain-containing protein n=1 Tax=Ridgeia piscesae TaxID=27915 RepID=A0AAD9KRR8_RIDPI|nr:hypothetical protein NP493_662g00015 [Ridgeia piscesae]
MADDDDDDLRPSIFELLAQDSLVLAEHNPSRFGWVYSLSDETYSLLHLIVEHSYLKQYHASFGEHFYQLKRVLTDQIRSSSRQSLPTPNHLRSLACLVLFPYIKAKCDLFYEELRDKADAGLPPMARWKVRCFRVFLALYPIMHLTWEGTLLCFHVAYLFGWTRVHNPLLKLAGVILQISSEDNQQTQILSAPLKLKNQSPTNPDKSDCPHTEHPTNPDKSDCPHTEQPPPTLISLTCPHTAAPTNPDKSDPPLAAPTNPDKSDTPHCSPHQP